MTMEQAVDAVIEGKRYIEYLKDFAENAQPSDRFLGSSEANHLAAVLKKLIDFVSNVELS